MRASRPLEPTLQPSSSSAPRRMRQALGLTAASLLAAATVHAEPDQPASVKQLSTVVVNADTADQGQTARDARAGLLGDKSVMEMPFSISGYTSRRIENQQAVTLAEVLNSDPSARFTGQRGGVTDSFFIRGFPINEGNLSEVALDGVYGVSPNYHLFTEYLERVEVLKGPAALLYGMSPNGGVGGVVNVVPKRATGTDATRVSFDYGAGSQAGSAVDYSRRYGAQRQFGLRFNALHREGDTALDNQHARADVGALSLDYRGERARTSLDIIAQHESTDAPTRPFVLKQGVEVPAAPDGARNVTQAWAWWKSRDTSALWHGEYAISETLTAFADAGGTRSDVSRYSDQTPTILNAAGDTSSVPQNWKFEIRRASADAGLRANLSTGPVRHALVLQVNGYRDSIGNAVNSGVAMSSNLYSPIANPDQAVAAPARALKVTESRLSGAALADTMNMLDDRLQVTLGLRHQRVRSRNFSASTGQRTTSYDESAVTPLAGVVLRPTEHLSVYANYIEGLSKGDIAPSTAANAGQAFAPYRTRQQEVGVKLASDGWLATMALFRITKPSGQLYGTVYAIDSEQRNQGLELSVSYEPAGGLRLLGGMTLLDAELTRTNSAATTGNRPVGVPEWMANAGAEWDLPWLPSLTFTGALTHTGQQYADQANTQSLPDWTTFDVGARYATRIAQHSATLRLGLLNAFDRHYWSGATSYGTLSLGAPRTTYLSVSVDF